ncbi:hypothetical protein RAB80_000509 [Fusarium oxysporum f. sp. vasinfectum]|nr:hypothetical protein RAB80_000509 [Fusarium oxysporum f. sp. vasinfectum]
MKSLVKHGGMPHAPISILNSLPVPCDEPPPKRRRVSTGLQRKRGVKECLLSQVTPLVERAVGHLSRDVYHVNALAIKTVTELSINKFFRRRWDETGGYLSQQDLDVLAIQAHDVVRGLAGGSEFRISPLSSETPEPQLLPPPRSTPKSQPQGQTAPTIVNTEATRKSEDRDSPIFYDALTSQPSHQPELPQNVERKPYRPRERREPKPSNRYYQISERPYLSAAHRKAIEEGTKKPVAVNNELIAQPIVYHVDFSPEEIAEIIGQISQNENKHIPATRESMMEQIRLRNRPLIPIPGRTIRDMSAFASDLWAGKVAETPRVLSFTAEHVTEETKKQQGQMRRTSRLSSLLMAREMEGNQGFQRTREYLNFQAEFKRLCEDDLQVVTEFTNCAGDITTGAWVSRELSMWHYYTL